MNNQLHALHGAPPVEVSRQFDRRRRVVVRVSVYFYQLYHTHTLVPTGYGPFTLLTVQLYTDRPVSGVYYKYPNF